MSARNAKSLAKQQDKRIERLYYKHCSGVQVDIMDIGKIFNAGRNALLMTPGLNDDQLGKVIVDFVQTIRKN